MPRKRFSVEQIIYHLREAEVLLAQGKTVGEICAQSSPLHLSRPDIENTM